MKTWDRPFKNITRDLASPSKIAKNSLWLAGDHMLDFSNADEKQLLDLGGHHIIVERNRHTASLIQHHIRKIHTPCRLFIGSLHALHLGRQLDYAHLDFCGGIDRETAEWISNMPVANDGEVHFTFTYAFRNNNFIKKCEDIIHSNPDLEQVYYTEYCDLCRKDENICTYSVIIRCLLRQYKFQALEPVLYRDSIQNMVLYRYQHFCKSAPICPSLSEVLDNVLCCERNPSMSKAKKRSAAALKAWDTRRANVKKQTPASDRSLAAKRAWKTRKANTSTVFVQPDDEVDAKRSKAAKKAWKTRRKLASQQ